MVQLFKKPQLSRVNARHLLDDLASDYTYPVEEAVVVEMIANSLDAGASNIEFTTNAEKGLLTVRDDGLGMDKEEFERYHDLAESQKVRGKGIGFAGLGAKLGHIVATQVVTETRKGSYRDVSEWRFRRDDLEWQRAGRRSLRRDDAHSSHSQEEVAADVPESGVHREYHQVALWGLTGYLAISDLPLGIHLPERCQVRHRRQVNPSSACVTNGRHGAGRDVGCLPRP